MSLAIPKNNWKLFLEKEKKIYQISSIAIISLTDKSNNDLTKKLTKAYQSITDSSMSEYLKKTLELRTDPQKLFPWAESLFIAAIPFSNIPQIDHFIPEAKNPLFAGKIAGYATRRDYHTYAQDMFKNFTIDLSSFVKFFNPDHQPFKSEICVDTMPVAERALAAFGNLGQIGKNASLITHDAGSGCFIAELFTDLEAPDIKASYPKFSCGSCGTCISACTNGALNSHEFGYSLCRSCLTMEKRGILSSTERQLLGEWIFGCDDCSSSCPGSKLPPPFYADIQWLLTANAADIKKRIKGTAIEYAGVTLLRRNALAVLGNRRHSDTLALIASFAKQTGSILLKTTAEEILDDNNKI